MKIEILGKKFPGNRLYKENTLYFKVDGIGCMINFIYRKFKDFDNEGKEVKLNAFLDGELYRDFESWFKQNYEGDFELFKQALMYELYKYSRGVNLDKLEIIDISSINRKVV